jgi:hypothetical protein
MHQDDPHGKDSSVGLASLPARTPYADRNQILKSFFYDRPAAFTTSPFGPLSDVTTAIQRGEIPGSLRMRLEVTDILQGKKHSTFRPAHCCIMRWVSRHRPIVHGASPNHHRLRSPSP